MVLCPTKGIDCDFEGERREEVKHYMEQRFGVNQVCSIGTYTTLQMKAAIKDLSRQKNVDFAEANYVTTVIDLGKGKMEELFENAAKKSRIKNFVQKNSDVINTLPLIIGQPKSQSIHACATLILPDEKDIFAWIPVKKMTLSDGQEMLVSEWEGGELEQIGMLKNDILGIKQLDKFSYMLNSIRKIENVDVNIYTLPLDDEKVYTYFQNGWCGDVFHFGSSGLTNYCKELKPDDVNDLIAGISLYRPGAMENNFHNEYILRKNGERQVDYLWGLEEISKETYGILCYQEQIMKACSIVGGFTLVEADDIRRAMGKKKKEILDRYRTQFVDGATKKGCTEDEAIDLWETLEKFAGYGFNASHAAAYAITGYVCQWLKVHYPIHYWTTAFRFGSENDIPNYISEINKTGSIKIVPPDINNSFTSVYTDFDKKTIYWALSAIKNCGETSTNQIIEEREKNGQFFSLEEFIERHIMKGSKVNKRVLENLLLSGAFDEIEDITNPVERLRLINQYRKRLKGKQDEEKDIFTNEPNLNQNWWWILQQKRLSGVAFFDYKDLCNNKLDTEYIGTDEFFKDSSLKSKCSIGGYVTEIVIRESKKGRFAKLTIESNYVFTNVLIWSEQFDKFEKLIEGCEKSIVLVSGTISFDKHNKTNQLQSNEYTEFLVLN